MMTEEQKQALIKHNIAKINSITPQFMKEALPGVKRHLQCEIDSAKLALDSLRAALTQPASPALKLPDYKSPCDYPEVFDAFTACKEWNRALNMVKELNGGDDAVSSNSGADFVCSRCSGLNAPHTAPIEPICATGGAEWVKVSDEMPLDFSDEHISEVEVIVTDGTTVGTCECRRGYMPRPWVEWSNYGDIDAEKITHWMPLPAAPEEEC